MNLAAAFGGNWRDRHPGQAEFWQISSDFGQNSAFFVAFSTLIREYIVFYNQSLTCIKGRTGGELYPGEWVCG
jgi:hypothetical protein